MLENIQIKTVSAWREKETASPAALTKNRVVNHFVHPPFNTALCAVTVSLSPTPRTRPRSRQPRKKSTPTSPLPTITITTSSKSTAAAPSLDIRDLGPLVSCQRGRRSHFHCWDVQCARARMWLSGWLVTWCAALYSVHCTVHCTVHLTPCHTA